MSRLGKRWPLAIAASCLLGFLPATAGAEDTAEPAAPEVTQIQPDAGNGIAISGTEGIIDLGKLGYQENEYLMSGTANTYRPVGEWTSDGKWQTEIAERGQPYTTRLLVDRPTDPKKFNGTVIVEWLNVSFGVDIPVDFSQSYRSMIDAGYAYVGVTAQQVGSDKLVSLDPARYDGVSISNDTLSYDIFTQAAQAVRNTPELFGGAAPKTVLASGHSQSAGRLVTYANAIQPASKAFDGIMVHGRSSTAAPIDDGIIGVSDAKIRTDLAVPTFILQAETDMPYATQIRQDSAHVRTWEVAGTAHADRYGLNLYNAQNARDHAINDGEPTTCDKPVNSMTFRYAQNAAYRHLERWAQGGAAPPKAEPIAIVDQSVRRDPDGNALGGIRLPDFEVPIATYSPTNTGGNVPGSCLLLGTTTPFNEQRIAELYPDHQTYVGEFVKAADAARDAGYLLPADHAEAVAAAKARPVP